MDQTINQAMLDNCSGIFYLKDCNLNYLGCSHGFAQLINLPSIEDISGKTDQDLIWSEFESDHFFEDDQTVLSKLKTVSKQYRLPLYAGEFYWVRLTKKPWHDDRQKLAGIFGTVEIIQQQKQTEQAQLQKIIQQETTRIIQKIHSTLSHDVKVPLAAIKMYIDILNKDLANFKIQDYAHNCKRFLQVLSKIEDISHRATMSLDWSILYLCGDIDQKTVTQINILECIETLLAAHPFSEGQASLITLEHGHNFSCLGHKDLFKKILFSLIKENITMLKGKPNGRITVKPGQVHYQNCIKIFNNGQTIDKSRQPYLFEHSSDKSNNSILLLCHAILKSFNCDISYSIDAQGHNQFTLVFNESH